MTTEARSRFINDFIPGLFALAGEEFKRYPETWKELYSVRTSSKPYEESAYGSGFGYLQKKKESVATATDARIMGPLKRWEHEAWGLKAVITHEAIEDSQHGFMARAMKNLTTSAQMTRHLEAIKLIMNGTVTTFNTVGDGLALFSQVHKRLDGGTYSNLAAAAAAPTTAAVEAAIKNFEKIRDDRGKQYNQKATYIFCGPEHEFTIAMILDSVKVAENENNGINAVKTRRNLKLIVEPEITDGRWGVGGMKNSDTGLIWFDREKPTITRHGDPDTGDTSFILYERHSNECNDPRQIYLIPGV